MRTVEEVGREERGAVFVEKLIVFLPLLMSFFAAWELAELGAASLVVQRASAAAGRAAIVVLPDDPAYYDGEPVGSYEGARRADIELAAGMILSAVPRLNDQFEVAVSDPPSGDVGAIEVTVDAQYDCELVSLLCGSDDAIDLSSTTRHTYQGARYAYSSVALGSSTEALSDGSFRASGSSSSTTGGDGAACTSDACAAMQCEEANGTDFAELEEKCNKPGFRARPAPILNPKCSKPSTREKLSKKICSIFSGQPEYVYRMDDRDPAVIAREGFAPLNPNANRQLRDHVTNNDYNSQWVSTTSDPDQAAAISAGRPGARIYRIKLSKRAVNVHRYFQMCGTKNPYDSQKEYAVEGGIPPGDVVGWAEATDLARNGADGATWHDM